MSDFRKQHGNGWWLHALGAVAIMLVGWWFGYLLPALVLNTLFWPARELWQKLRSPSGFFTFHVTLEWFPAVAVGGLCYLIMQ